MQQGMIAFVLLITGCQGLPVLDRWETAPPASVMPVWDRYQQCLATSEPAELLQLVEQIERVMLTGPEPPAWMKSWSPHVTRQPLRAAVDPYALGAACTIRTASIMAAQNRLHEAQALYRRVVTRYQQQEWAYYREQANEGLASLSLIDVALITPRTTLFFSHTR